MGQKFDALARQRGCTARQAVGVFYATQTGNTEDVASRIAEATGLEASDYDGEDFADLDGVIAGCPTWNTGADEYRSGTTWDDYVDTIKEYDLSGKTVAIFGCGDSKGVNGGKFLGLPLDQDNEDDQTDDRIAAWVE